MRYDADHRIRTRERIVVEAAQAIRSSGPEKLSLSGVMAKAGLTNGGFYAHFKSRDELLTAGVEQMFVEGRAPLYLVRKGHDARTNLAAFLDFYLSPVHRDSKSMGCPIAFLSTEAPRLPKKAARRFAEGVRSLTDLLAETLQRIDAAEPALEARSLLNEIVGAISLARAEKDKDLSTRILSGSRRSIGRRYGLEEK